MLDDRIIKEPTTIFIVASWFLKQLVWVQKVPQTTNTIKFFLFNKDGTDSIIYFFFFQFSYKHILILYKGWPIVSCLFVEHGGRPVVTHPKDNYWNTKKIFLHELHLAHILWDPGSEPGPHLILATLIPGTEPEHHLTLATLTEAGFVTLNIFHKTVYSLDTRMK